jgi:exopolysaccharide biosynthesis polyprenyl glycosylphosphotransferase
MSLSSPLESKSASLSVTTELVAELDLHTILPHEMSSHWIDPAQRTGKRVIDLVGAGLGLLVLSPMLLLVALLIRLTSRGPVLFRQTRLGLNGEPFQIYKFRTMVTDAEARLRELEHLNESEGGVLFKMKRDPRITAIGRILRKTSLDELPQLWNVLRGDMSLVGPRPLQMRDCLLLAQVDVKGYRKRLAVLPGLTGLWQARGRSETGFEHMLRLDGMYIQEWSLWLDVVILLETVVGVVRGKGAC